MIQTMRATGVVLLAAMLAVCSPTLASATPAPPDDAAAFAALTEDAAATAAPPPSAAADGVATATTATTTLPSAEGEGIVLTSAAGDVLDVPVPAIGEIEEVTSTGSYVSHSGDGGDALIATPLHDGVRLAVVVDDEEDAQAIDFPLPAATEAEVQPDGSLLVFSDSETVVAEDGLTFEMSSPVALVERPWALDASGRELETSYSVEDGLIVQSVAVDESTSYPVIADPTYRLLNPVQMRIRWNRAETATIAAGGRGATGITAVCAAVGGAMGPVGIVLLGGGCFAFSGAAVYTAGLARNSSPRRCLEATASAIPGVPILLFNTWRC